MEYTPIKCNKSGKLHPVKHWKTAPVDMRIRQERKKRYYTPISCQSAV